VPAIARFVGQRVTAGTPGNRYQDYDDCVKVTAIAEGSELKGVSTIITNRSSWMELDSSGPFEWDVLASFPEDCVPAASQGQALLALGHPDDNDKGIAILSADASLFTNGMLWHGDNAVLAIRVATLLAGTDRQHLAFWADVNGRALAAARDQVEQRARSAQPLPTEQPLPEPDLAKMLKLANALASEVAQSNVLNETLKQRPRHVLPSRYFRVLLIMATAAMFVGAVWLLVTSGALRPFSAVGRKAAGQTVPGQRVLAPNPAGDFRTPAGYLAREFCWELTGSRQSTDWQKYLARQLSSEPTLSPPDQHELAKIIDIASRGCRERMSVSDFQQLGKTIAALRAKQPATHGERPVSYGKPEG